MEAGNLAEIKATRCHGLRGPLRSLAFLGLGSVEIAVNNGYRCGALVGTIVLVTMLRLVPHPWNLAPVGAMALFGGACFAHRWAAFLVPLAAMFLSDLALGLMYGDLTFGLHPVIPFVYGSLAASVCLGFLLRGRRTVLPIAGTVLAGSVLFFLVTNFGMWATFDTYPKTWDGLVACYVAGIPYFHSTLLGDALYATVLFGGLAIAEAEWPVLREVEPERA